MTDDLHALLRGRALCFIATTMPDGSPQLTETWADTDGEHVLINTVAGFQKLRNVERDPRVAVAVADPEHPVRYLQVRGRVVETRTDGAAEHIEALAQKYTGAPYAWYGGRDQQRVLLVIAVDKVSGVGF
ncbi:PPOX class probable F420-dependent enzyme [Friedmanniella endophytica]|uniref:PPOX class probable F420-dependent enzyme n=1 Tax=Microlunatus kandeliicorticis TaxID=1759536 RepID=A0A7W3IUJ8_9ACTN|nr:PPOX class F420-dependent oxidoreductase [Microlunatus kandeliicorticis]MBA8795459.1 PPOX class probable F420-dependent enzyme [Microlunatus kandeliicorticis]